MDDITVVVAAYVRNEAIYWIVSKLLMPTTEAEDIQLEAGGKRPRTCLPSIPDVNPAD